MIIYTLGINLDFHLVKKNLFKVTPKTLILCIGWIEVNYFIHALRWQEIIGCNFRKLPLSELWRHIFAANFLNQCLPSSVGGDVYRGLVMRYQYKASNRWAVSSTFMDRLYGFIGFIFLGVVAFPFQMKILFSSVLGKVVTVTLLGGMMGFVILLMMSRLPMTKFQRKKAFKPFFKLSEDLSLTINNGKKAFRVMLFTFLTTITVILPFYHLAQNLNIDLSLSQALITLPFAFVVSAVPLSLAGWGLREGAIISILHLFRVPYEEAFSLSLLLGFILLLSSLPGLGFWLTQNYQKNKR